MAKANNSERDGLVSRLKKEHPGGLKSVSGFAISGDKTSYFVRFRKTLEGLDVFDVKYWRNGYAVRTTEMHIPVSDGDYVARVVEYFYELQESLLGEI